MSHPPCEPGDGVNQEGGKKEGKGGRMLGEGREGPWVLSHVYKGGREKTQTSAFPVRVFFLSINILQCVYKKK